MSTNPQNSAQNPGSGQQPGGGGQGGPQGPHPGGQAAAYPFPAGPQAQEAHSLPPQRPGTVTAAAVLGFIVAGFEIIGGLLWMLGGAVIGSFEEYATGESTLGGLISILGLVCLVLGGLYIWGGVATLKGKWLVLLSTAGVGAVVNLTAAILFDGGYLSLALAAVIILLLSLPGSRNYRAR